MAEPSWVSQDANYDSLTIIAVPEGRPKSRNFVFRETRVEVDGEAGKAKWDVKEAPGTDGARETYQGYTPARPQVKWLLFTAEHETEFYEMRAVVGPVAGKRRPPVVLVAHPLLYLNGGLSIFNVEELSLPKASKSGLYEVTLKLIEWFPHPKSTPPAKKATGDITSVPVAKALQAPTTPAKPSKTGNGP